jgi:uncharacterized membrane protein (DUF106 family)
MCTEFLLQSVTTGFNTFKKKKKNNKKFNKKIQKIKKKNVNNTEEVREKLDGFLE